MGSSRTLHNRNIAVGKRGTDVGDSSRNASDDSDASDNSGNAGGLDDTGDEPDAGDFIALCWANNPAALERQRLAEENFRQKISGWVAGVSE
ncbi:hypothetical protein K439DRAFT_1634934 [Ramaria rubella]|nr:hypothetical protein K439DRAFT_1634934 [Ramaria rubella]